PADVVRGFDQRHGAHGDHPNVKMTHLRLWGSVPSRSTSDGSAAGLHDMVRCGHCAEGTAKTPPERARSRPWANQGPDHRRRAAVSPQSGTRPGAQNDQSPTSAAVPPVMRRRSSKVVGKTVLGWPAAAHTVS